MKPMSREPTPVFISYSHDSAEHRDLVLSLSERLRQDGFDAQIDQYVNGTPTEGWPRWMLDQLDRAAFVLVVCTETYYRRFRGHEEQNLGKGVNWEGALITQLIYDSRSRTSKFVPLLCDAAHADFIPEPLRGDTHYLFRVKEGYSALRDFLDGAGGIEPGPVRMRSPKTRRQGAPLSFGAVGSSMSNDIATPARSGSSPTRFVSYSQLPDTGEFLFGRDQELERLDDAWADTGTNVVSLIAWGGVGKSALVRRWLGAMGKEHYRGTERVFGWSFQNQGTRETATSADLFIHEALTKFGDDDPKAGTAKDRAKRLVTLVQEERSLLILDGLEPLQHPPGHGDSGGGDLKDPALATLVRALAADNPGLCILTTRLSIKELQPFSGTTALVIELEQLSPTAGAALLAALGVQGSQDELENASREFGGHGLALNLLGTYLRDVCGGDVSRRGEIPLREEDKEHGGHAWQMLASYETWLGEGPELAVLRLLGLFDRPAEGKLLDVLRKPPSIAHLTKTLVELESTDQWRRVLGRLRKARLIDKAQVRDPDRCDVHPLVREYFSDQVQEKFPEAWREGHRRLYEYLREETTDLPEDLRGMTALSQVVAHGCHAGRHQEVLDDVYRRRMHRGPEAYSQFTIGAIGDDLAAVSCFFDLTLSDQPWDQPVAGLVPKSQGYVLNEAGWDLRALGRITEGIRPMTRAVEVRQDAEDWIAAANSAANCSTIYLQLGELAEALKYAQKGVELAERSDDRSGPWGPQHSYNRAFLGEALHKVGRTEEAAAVFRKAERIQEEWDPARPLLFAVLAGFLYCDFLLDQGKYQEVKQRAIQTLEWNIKEGRIRDIALDHLSLGRAILLEALQEKDTGDLSEAMNHIDTAVADLFKAKQEDHLLLGLLAHAALRRVQGKLPDAWTDVEKVLEIAGAGPMKLHQADAYLESTRLWLEEGERDKALNVLVRGKTMIDAIGYHRRDREVAELEKKLAER